MGSPSLISCCADACSPCFRASDLSRLRTPLSTSRRHEEQRAPHCPKAGAPHAQPAPPGQRTAPAAARWTAGWRVPHRPGSLSTGNKPLACETRMGSRTKPAPSSGVMRGPAACIFEEPPGTGTSSATGRQIFWARCNPESRMPGIGPSAWATSCLAHRARCGS